MQSILAVALSLAIVAPPKLLSDPDAQAKFEEAQTAFQNSDYRAAADAIKAAYEIEPLPALLYPWAQAEREAGNCQEAVGLYQRAIDAGVSDEIADAARVNIERCNEILDEQELVVVDDEEDLEDETAEDETAEDEAIEEELFGEEEEEEPEPEPEPEPVVEKPPQTTTDEQPKAKKWYADPTGGVLTGLGLAGVGAGVGLLVVANSRAKTAADEDLNSDYLDMRDSATKLRNGGAAALAIGSTLLLGGIIRYAVVAKKNKAATASVFVGPRGMAGVSISGRF